jgi:hypothetical protein
MSIKLLIKDRIIKIKGKKYQKQMTFSIKPDKYNITFNYWDYLAWAVYKSQVKKFLMLGLGGGTTLEILSKWKVTPTCIGVENNEEMITELKRKGWLSYSNLFIVIKEVCTYIDSLNPNNLFNAIVVDLYDTNGYVQKAYKEEYLRKYLKHIPEDGFVFLHCFDPSMKYIALNFMFPELCKPKSITYSIANELCRQGARVALIPLWESALVISTKSDEALRYFFSRPKSNNKENLNELNWLSSFLMSRKKTINELKKYVDSYTKKEYTYKIINHNDLISLNNLLSSLPVKKSQEIIKLLNIEERSNQKQTKKIRVLELHSNGLMPIQERTLNVLLNLKALLTSITEGFSPLEGIRISEQILKYAEISQNYGVREIASFALAYQKRYKEAIDILEQHYININGISRQ